MTRQVCEKVHYQEVCRDVTTQECSQQPQEQCREVPREHCQEVNERQCDTVQKEECKNVPRTDCKQTSESQCRSFPSQENSNVPELRCAQGRLPGAQPAVMPGGFRQGLPEEVRASLLPGAQDPDQGGLRAQVLHRHQQAVQPGPQAGNTCLSAASCNFILLFIHLN